MGSLKKYLVFSTLVAMLIGTFQGGLCADEKKSINAKFTNDKIVLDGKMDEKGWELSKTIEKSVIGTGNNSAHFGLVWDKDYLYVGIAVDDEQVVTSNKNIWDNDSVEVYISADDSQDTYTIDDRQYIFAVDNERYYVSNGSGQYYPKDDTYAMIRTDDGYALEMEIPWQSINVNTDDLPSLKFDIGLNDCDTGEKRESQMMWSGSDINYKTKKDFGLLGLINDANAEEHFVKLVLNGKNLSLESKPVIENERILTPVRRLCEQLGCSVTWDAGSNSAVISREDLTIALKDGSAQALVNGETAMMDSSAVIRQGILFAPLRFITEQLNTRLEWDEAMQTANMTSDYSPESNGERTVLLENDSLKVLYNKVACQWSVVNKKNHITLSGLEPWYKVDGYSYDLSHYDISYLVDDVKNNLGAYKRLKVYYSQDNGIDLIYSIMLSNDSADVVVQTDMANNSGKDIIVDKIYSLNQAYVQLGGQTKDWRVIGDVKSHADHYNISTASDISANDYFWYVAMKNISAGGAIMMGNLSNNKGIGKFTAKKVNDTALGMTAYNSYERITMPTKRQITGEPLLISFGETGTDTLMRFGDMIANNYNIKLQDRFDINPYNTYDIGENNYYNPYGAGVMKNVKYSFDSSKYDYAYNDPDWCNRNKAAYDKLGLKSYGVDYGFNRPHICATARDYGRTEGESQEFLKAHPECYINGLVDFSNPVTQQYEQSRIDKALHDKTGPFEYYADFTDLWAKLNGQYDPFMTSAETYRLAFAPWRKAALSRDGSYGAIWMNPVGYCYDLVDFIHIGCDSDNGYYGDEEIFKNCSFVNGLVRQITGRFFYNGKVWWNNADTFHVYAQGTYSYEQGKVHASFTSMTGNFYNVGEPFCDEELPEDRLELIKKTAPATAETAYPVDLFESDVANIWNMPVKRSFGNWNVVGLFNCDLNKEGKSITKQVDFKDLGLKEDKQYLVYEFWKNEFLGVLTKGFERTIKAPDCEIYSVVEKKDQPQLISTNRHMRDMAYDIRKMAWDNKTLSGTSMVVHNDPYQLVVYAPKNYQLRDIKVDGQKVATDTEKKELENGDVLYTITVKPTDDGQINWKMNF